MLRDFPPGEEDCGLTGNYRLRSLELSPSPTSQCVRGNLASQTGDCSQYLVCQAGHYQQFSCPPGLHWNRVSQNFTPVTLSNSESSLGPL